MPEQNGGVKGVIAGSEAAELRGGVPDVHTALEEGPRHRRGQPISANANSHGQTFFDEGMISKGLLEARPQLDAVMPFGASWAES